MPLTSLPVEIILEIFTLLSPADHARARRTCQIFNQVAEKVPTRKYVFKVDAMGHPTWRLIRRLLQNPKVVENFVEVKVEWYRRDVNAKETWTPCWQWTEDERQKIQSLANTLVPKPSAKTVRTILRGFNSESLLPLLLYFTPKLETFNMGHCESSLIIPVSRFGSWSTTMELFQTLLPGEMKRKLSESREERRSSDFIYEFEDNTTQEGDAEHFGKFNMGQMMEVTLAVIWNHAPNERSLFFHEYAGKIGCTVLSPGHGNIKHLAYGFNKEKSYIDEFSHDRFISLLLLPRLQTVKVIHQAWVTETEYFSSELVGKKSTVKRLEYREEAIMWCVDLLDTANFTEQLEEVIIDLNKDDKKSPIRKPQYEEIAAAFLENNPSTLKPENITICGWRAG